MRIGNRNTDISIAPIKLKNLSLNLSRISDCLVEDFYIIML